MTFRVLTVHWEDDRWIRPQLRFLTRNLDDFRVYASLNGVDPSWSARFHFAEDLPGTHPEKLNALAEIARADGAPDDLLLFLDGDAFPIAPVTRAVLGDTSLAAVRRDENLGQTQPHPCFCVTTAAFWSDIEGDWREGHTWTASNGAELTDVGGNLLGILEARNIAWRPLLRTNRVNLDPLWFGIYADLAYHHGAGFRAPVSYLQTQPGAEARRAAVAAARTPEWVPIVGRAERSMRYRLARRRVERAIDEHARDAQDLSDEVFGWIESDDDFYRRFL
jgi:hypothetical protein